MPIYEYECKNCHHRFDALQKLNDEPLKLCPQCNEEKVIRLISAVAFHLKGTGWYATDFKNKGAPPKEKSTQSDETKTSDADQAKTSSVKSIAAEKAD